jgi:hypothetical protein
MSRSLVIVAACLHAHTRKFVGSWSFWSDRLQAHRNSSPFRNPCSFAFTGGGTIYGCSRVHVRATERELMVLYCAADLLWATRIKSTADALGVPCRPARTVEMLEARLSDSPVRALLVDLEAGENALALIRRLRRARTSEPASLTTTQSGGRQSRRCVSSPGLRTSMSRAFRKPRRSVPMPSWPAGRSADRFRAYLRP